MTDLGAVPAGEWARPSPPARPQTVMPPAQVTVTAPQVHAAGASRAAARDAALTALSAARTVAPLRPAPMPVRAAARLQPLRPAPSPPAKPGCRAGLLGGIGVPQIICWQLVLIAVLLVLDQAWPAITLIILGALVVLALTAVRVRGRWLYQWVTLWSTYLLRDRAATLPAGTEAGSALLRLFSPEATGITGEVNDEPVFMISRAAGITAVLQPRVTNRELTRALPPPERLLPPAGEQALAFAVQIVHHAGVQRDRPPRVWVALQALRTVDVHRDADVQRALGNAIRRVQCQLRRDGRPARTLAEQETLGTLAALAHVNADRGQVHEDWRTWQSGPIAQVTFQLTGWADLATPAASQLVRWLLTATPGVAVTVAVTAHRSPTRAESEVRATLRLAATSPATLDAAATQLSRRTQEHGISPDRLDARHATGVAATLPLGLAE